MHSRNGFSIIELLVVITIIVVLLTLLSPALDQAVYQAELTACAARQDSAAAGVLAYAMNFRRWYPYRTGPRDVNWVPPYVCSNDHDDRDVIFAAISPKLLLDPFCDKIDLTTRPPFRQVIYAQYNMYFSWRFQPTGANGKQKDREKGMYRLGDRFTWTDVNTGPAPFTRAYNIILSDFDVIRDEPPPGSSTSSDASKAAQAALGGHPDRDQSTMVKVMVQDDVLGATFYEGQGQVLTASYWRNQNTQKVKRGLYDAAYAYDDGSVLRYNAITWDERGRMDFIPESNNRPFDEYWGQQVPRQ